MTVMSTNVSPSAIARASEKDPSQGGFAQNPLPVYHQISNPALVSNVGLTQHEEVQHSQQLIEALAKVTQIQRLPQAKPDIFRGDEKDKTKYFLWEKAFQRPRRFSSTDTCTKTRFALPTSQETNQNGGRTTAVYDRRPGVYVYRSTEATERTVWTHRIS